MSAYFDNDDVLLHEDELNNTIHENNTFSEKKKNKKKNRKKKADVDKNLICSECGNMFNQPKILSCMHTFCLACIEKLLPAPQCEANNQNVPPDISNNQNVEGEPPAPAPEVANPEPTPEPTPEPPKIFVTCPICQEQTEIEGEVDKLPTHFTFQNVIEVLESENTGGPKCDECVEKEEVVYFCNTCNLSMCQTCSDGHKRSTRYKRHVLTPACDVPREKLLKGRKFYCDEHDCELKYFCKNCEKSICQDCPIGRAHLNHEYALIGDVLLDKKEEVSVLLNKGRTASDSIKNFLDISQQMLHNSGTEKDKSIAHVQESFDQFQNVLKERKEKLIKEIIDNHEAGKASLENAKKKFEVLQKLLEYSQTALEMANQVSNIEVMAELKKQLENLFTTLDVDQITPTQVSLPPDAAPSTQPSTEVFGVTTTLFQENKGNLKIEVQKKNMVVENALFQQIIETCQKAMSLYAKN